MVARRHLAPIELAPLPQLGPPTAGLWRLGTLVSDAAGSLWWCSASGTPGSWIQLGQAAAGPVAGEMRPWPGARSQVPSGWLLCDGRALLRSAYAALFGALCPSYTVSVADAAANTLTLGGGTDATGDMDAGLPVRLSGSLLPGGLAAGTTYFAIPVGASTIRLATSLANALAGTAIDLTTSGGVGLVLQAFPFGVGDGVTTFSLPDTRRRALVGSGGVGTAVLAACLGAVGGAEAHTLTVAEMPSHSHAAQAGRTTGSGGGAIAQQNLNNSTFSPLIATGGGGAHNNLPPSLVLHWIIKA